MSYQPIPSFVAGQVITAADLNRVVDAVNTQLRANDAAITALMTAAAAAETNKPVSRRSLLMWWRK